jgi:hypothetical protein
MSGREEIPSHINDVPKAILVLQKAFEYITAKRDPGQFEDSPASDLYG